MKFKLKINKSVLLKIVKFLKWGKLLAKLTAIGTTVSGAITALMGSATTGIALSAAGATTYAATKNLPSQGYEKTKHIPPGRVDKTANMLRQAEITKKSMKSGKMGGAQAMLQAGVIYSKQPGRGSSIPAASSTMSTFRKK